MLKVSSWLGTLGRPFIDIDRERSERVLEMVGEGWRLASAHPSVHVSAGEVEITECLRDGMRAALGERATDYRYRQMIEAYDLLDALARGSAVCSVHRGAGGAQGQGVASHVPRAAGRWIRACRTLDDEVP